MPLLDSLAKLGQKKPLDIHAHIQKTIRVSHALQRFWSASHGWAPVSAANLLAEARLDRQTAFAHTLPDYLEPFATESAEAKQILGYVTLRSMSEGALKLFFSVWFEDYQNDPGAIRDRRGSLISPEDVTFDRLIAFFTTKFGSEYQAFLRRVQQRGNSIHHFNDRDIGTQPELIADIREFGEFLLSINDGLPYPDHNYDPAHA